MTLMTLTALLSLLVAQHQGMPPGMTHEEHLKQMAKEDALKKRGAAAMGFDQDAVVHHFTLEPDGGTIAVAVKDATSDAGAATLAAVRAHLREIATAFGRGDFSASIATHAEVPPGVERMKALKGDIQYRYSESPDGGRVSIRTASAEARDAVHAFLRYQINEHHTGDKGVQ